MTATDLRTHPIHLGLGATAEIEPAFTGALDWYEAYGARHEADGAEGRLVALHTISNSWDAWEMHPNGAEVVLCVDGAIDLIQELPDGSTAEVALGPGEYTVNPPGVWHTADVRTQAIVLFITAGLGTEHRAR